MIFLIRDHAPSHLEHLLSLLLFTIVSISVDNTSHVGAEQPHPGLEEPAYSYGILPYFPASRLEGVFAPIAAELSKALGRKILYRSSATYMKFMRRLEQQEFDIAFIQPFDYVRIAAKKNYLPLVKRREPFFAIFVVREDSPYKHLSDLKGAHIAMAPEVAALSYLGKAALLEVGLVPQRDILIRHVRGHHSCLRHVLIRNVDACVTGYPAKRLFESEMDVTLRVLAETPVIPQMLFIVHTRVPDKDREQMKRTLLATTLSGVEPELWPLLVKDGETAFIPATDADYDIVRKYWQSIENSQ